MAARSLHRDYGFHDIPDWNGDPRAGIWMDATLQGEGRVMANATVTALKKKSDAASANLNRQLEGMEPYLERSDAPGEWTTRQVLCHLLFEPGWEPASLLRTFAE